MAKKFEGREEEISALMDIPGVDPAKIAAQLNPDLGKSGEGDPPPAGKEGKKEEGGETQGKEGKEGLRKEDVPDESTIRTGILNEIFGDQYKTVDEVKSLNIPDALKERDNLREEVTNLKTQLGKKPKHSFASDDLAKFNEFAGATGIQSFEVFRKLNSSDIANMDDMDALVWMRIAEDPELSADISRVRKNFERKFNVDKSKIESGDLTQEEYDDNIFSMRTEARNAKKKLSDLKEKIKMPEVKEETPDTTVQKKWTPEVEKKQKEAWGNGVKAILDVFSKVPIPMKDAKDPIINFVLPEEIKTKLMQDALNHAINNQMEVSDTDIEGNKAKALAVTSYVYDKIIVRNLPLIVHAVFERAHGMSKEEAAKLYHNPSEIKKEEGGGEQKTPTFDENREKAYNLDYQR